MVKDKQRDKDLANARKKKQREKEKALKKDNVIVRKTANVRDYNAKAQKSYRSVRYGDLTARNINYIGLMVDRKRGQIVGMVVDVFSMEQRK